MTLLDSHGVSLTASQRNERHNFVRSIFQTNTLAKLDHKFLERPEMFASLFALATIDYGVSKKTLASLLGLESADVLEGWDEPENAPSVPLRVRTTYLIGALLSAMLYLEQQNFSPYELDIFLESGSPN